MQLSNKYFEKYHIYKKKFKNVQKIYVDINKIYNLFSSLLKKRTALQCKAKFYIILYIIEEI